MRETKDGDETSAVRLCKKGNWYSSWFYILRYTKDVAQILITRAMCVHVEVKKVIYVELILHCAIRISQLVSSMGRFKRMN